MPLEESGVRFDAANINEFLRNMANAAKAVSGFGDVSDEALDKANAAVSKLAEGLTQLDETLQDVSGKDISQHLESIGNAVDGLKKKTMASLPKITQVWSDNIKKFSNIGATIGSVVGGIVGALGLITGPFGTVTAGAGIGIGRLFGGFLGGLLSFLPNVIATAKYIATTIANNVKNIIASVTGAIGNLLGSIGEFFTKTVPGVIGKIAKAGFDIGKAIVNFAGTIISKVTGLIGKIAGGIGNFFSSIIGLFTGGGGGYGGWRSLGDSLLGAMFKFEILKQVIRKTIEVIKDLSKESFDAAVNLQTLTIRLDNLIAVDIRNIGLTKDLGESMQLAGKYSQDLIYWMQNLALATPVSIDDISRMVYLSMAMGWSVKSAKDLTMAIVDYTATLGMGSEISERIIYNFAQMKQQGKVTGTELRDLGRGAFMPINDILRKMYDNLGETSMNFEEFRKQASEGAIAVEDFFKAFEDWVGENMPGAAYKLNYTFEAVIQNIHDLFKILLGWNVFGPTIKSITAPLQNLINQLKTPSVLRNAQGIGKGLAFIIDSLREGLGYIGNAITGFLKLTGLGIPSIYDFIKTLIKLGITIKAIAKTIADFIISLFPFAKQIGDKFGTTFKDMRDDFFGWGLNLMASFAKGIIRGAAEAITAAIRFVAGLLTKMFSTHSPPAILPDIDKWGMETISAWLHGFTEADFGVLDDLKKSVKESLDAMAMLGVLDETQVAQKYLNISAALIGAIDEFKRTGKVTSDIYQQLASIGGVFGKELVKLLDLELQQVVMQQRLTDAQKAYDEAVKNTARTEKKVIDSVRNYNEMLRHGAGRNILRTQLGVVNVAQDELDAARVGERMRQTELDIAKAQLDIVTQQVEEYQKMISAMADLIQQQKELKEGAAGTETELDNAIQNTLDDLGDLSNDIGSLNFEGLLAEAEAEFKTQWKDFTEELGLEWRAAFTDPNSDFQIAINSIKTAWSGTIDWLKTTWDEFATTVGLPTSTEIQNAMNGAKKWVEGGWKTRRQGGQEFETEYVPGSWEPGGLVEKFQAVMNLFAADIENNGGIMATMGRIASYIWTALKNKLSEMLAPGSTFRADLASLGNQVLGVLADIISGPQTVPGGTMGIGNVEFDTPLERIGKTLGSSLVKGLTSVIPEEIQKFDWKGLAWGLIQNSFLTFFDIGQVVSGLFTGNGVAVIDGLTSGMIDTITGFNFIKEVWSVLTSSFTSLFKNGSDSLLFKQYGFDIINGLTSGITSMIDNVIGPQGTVTVAIQGFINDIKNFFGIGKTTAETNPFINIGNSIIDGIVNGINAFKGKILATIGDLGIDIPEWLRKLLEASSPSRVFMRIGQDTMRGLAIGISKSGKMVRSAMSGTMGNAVMQPTIKMMAPMQASPVYSGATVNFGDVHINNQMDWAVFKAQVQRAIIEG